MQSAGSLPTDVFYYLDPPFFEKASKLYRYWFSSIDHTNLRDHLHSVKDPWLVSYDYHPQVDVLYGAEGGNGNHLEVLYSATTENGRRIAREALITNVLELNLPTGDGVQLDSRTL